MTEFTNSRLVARIKIAASLKSTNSFFSGPSCIKSIVPSDIVKQMMLLLNVWLLCHSMPVESYGTTRRCEWPFEAASQVQRVDAGCQAEVQVHFLQSSRFRVAHYSYIQKSQSQTRFRILIVGAWLFICIPEIPSDNKMTPICPYFVFRVDGGGGCVSNMIFRYLVKTYWNQFGFLKSGVGVSPLGDGA